MSQENGLSVDMKKLDNILVSNNTSTTGLRECLGGNNLPFIVRIIVAVTGNLLPYTESLDGIKPLKKAIKPWLLIRPSSYFKG